MSKTYTNTRPLAIIASEDSEQFMAETVKELQIINPKREIRVINRTIEHFENSEIGVEILDSVKGCEVYIIQAFVPGKLMIQ